MRREHYELLHVSAFAALAGVANVVGRMASPSVELVERFSSPVIVAYERGAPAVLAGVVVIAVFLWFRNLVSRPATVLAYVLCVAYPLAHPLKSGAIQDVMHITFVAIWLPALVGIGVNPSKRPASYVALGAGTIFGVCLISGGGGTVFGRPDLLREWVVSFVRLTPEGANLRSMLAGYVVDAPVLLLAGLGAAVAVRKSPALWWPPLVLVPLSAALSLLLPGRITFRAFYPVILGFASIGFWEVYAGLGRTSGHGILAIDPVREKPRGA